MKKLPHRGKQLVQGHLEMTELEFEPMWTGLVGQEGSYSTAASHAFPQEKWSMWNEIRCKEITIIW